MPKDWLRFAIAALALDHDCAALPAAVPLPPGYAPLLALARRSPRFEAPLAFAVRRRPTCRSPSPSVPPPSALPYTGEQQQHLQCFGDSAYSPHTDTAAKAVKPSSQTAIALQQMPNVFLLQSKRPADDCPSSPKVEWLSKQRAPAKA